MDKLDAVSGDKIAEAIDRRIVNVAKEVYIGSPNNKTKFGRVVTANNGIFSVKIENSIYTNIFALRNVGVINVGEVAICLVPNGQYSNMLIIGVADGTIQQGSYILPQAGQNLGGVRANSLTTETNEVKINPTTGFLYASAVGEQGPVGPQGNTGPQGLQGTSFRNRGVWVSGTSYLNNTNYIDFVYYEGSSYVCNISNISTIAPDIDTTNWSILALAGGTPNLLQNTGTSISDAMSQNAVSTLMAKIDASNIIVNDWLDALVNGEVGYGDRINTILLQNNGYIKYSSGLIFQWARYSNISGTRTLMYPMSFPNNCFSVVVQQYLYSQSDWDKTTLSEINTSSFKILSTSYAMNYFMIAIGN